MDVLSRQRGFTLLELLVVVTLMALFSGIILSAIPRVLPFDIRSASRELAADLQYASQHAIATGGPAAFVVDLDAQAFRIEREQEHEEPADEELVSHAELLDLKPPQPTREFLPLDSAAGEWRVLEESDIAIERIRIGDSEVDRGIARIRFGADGSADPAELWLADPAGRGVLLRVAPFTGEVRIDLEPAGG